VRQVQNCPKWRYPAPKEGKGKGGEGEKDYKNESTLGIHIREPAVICAEDSTNLPISTQDPAEESNLFV
jgi:hypothetical protein